MHSKITINLYYQLCHFFIYLMFNKYLKSKLINQTIIFPKRTLFISLFLTLLLSIGLKWFIIDDDFMKLLPQNIQSKIIWDEIQNDFGASEIMLIAFGNKNKSIYRKEAFNAIWDLTENLENHPLIEEVISIKTLNKLESNDGFMEVDELFSNRDLSQNDIKNIQQYLIDNPSIKARVISTHNDYTSIMIRPKLEINMVDLVNSITPLSESILKDFEIHYAGQIYITGKVPDLIQDDTLVLMKLALILMILILLINFRSISLVIMILVTILLSMLSMFGFMGWMHKITGLYIFNFTMMNTSMPVVLLTIANSDGVHMLTRFLREFRKKHNVKHAVNTTLNALFLPIFLTSFTNTVSPQDL